MRVAMALAGVSLQLALSTWLLLSGLNLNSDRYDRQLQALADFTRFERGIGREVLTSRAGLSRNYDALVKAVRDYEAALQGLRESAASDPEENAAVERLAARAGRHEQLIEQFKSSNALLENSFAYFGMFGARLSSSEDQPLATGFSALAAALLQLTLNTSSSAAGEVQSRLDGLERLHASPEEAASVRAVIAHGKLLLDVLPAVDSILKLLVAEASNREQDTVHALIIKRQLAARAAARQNRLLQYLTSLLLLGGLVYFGRSLRARAKALRRRAAFEHVIANISMRFIDTRHVDLPTHVESALEALAGCIGADRAYFAWQAPTTCHAYQWTREGVSREESWPERALGLARWLEAGEDAIIYIRKVRPSHSYDAMSQLDEAGVRGWLCIKPLIEQQQDAILGFDAVQVATLSDWAEIVLFRLAFDAIRNAVRRVSLEREMERLYARLQQARRMETIGTFASGIAHNFNNIVGAILGYVELAGPGTAPGSRSATSLNEIRRAGERARELVGQILSFGRRSGGRQELVRIEVLVAETTGLLAASLPSHAKLAVIQSVKTATVLGDPAQLQQVIINLCNNAAQALEKPGLIKLCVAKREIIRPLRIGRTDLGTGRFTVISVTDPGHGMDDATLEQIFEPFFTTRAEGTGLGLATVREIVERHGGAVEVQTAPGTGARFDVWLPCGGSIDPPKARQPPPLAFRGDGETILVLEVDRRRLLHDEELLAALGYEPVGFTELTAAEAACRAARQRFDAALVCHVPGGSSLGLAAVLHQAVPDLPIILASPSTHEFAAHVWAASGIAEMVHHPLLSSELAVALARCLGATSSIG